MIKFMLRSEHNFKEYSILINTPWRRRSESLVYYDNMKTEIIPKYQSIAIGNNIWQNWFGTDITTVNESDLSSLFADYKRAIFSASVLAPVTEQRFRSDTSHFGYMAHQEFFLKEVLQRKILQTLWCITN